MTSAGTVCHDADFYPYGGERVVTDSCDQSFKFTGKERDPETGNDYFGARFYSSSFGRFLSPDWSATVEPVPYAKLGNPQSLNLYLYVRDNPESVFDPDGHLQHKAAGHQLVMQPCNGSATAPARGQSKPLLPHRMPRLRERRNRRVRPVLITEHTRRSEAHGVGGTTILRT